MPTQNKETLQWVSRTRCPVCEQGRRRLEFIPGELRIYECSRCAVRYLDPCLSEDSTAAIYQSSQSLENINPFLGHYYEENPEKIWNGITGKDYERSLGLCADVPGRSLLDIASGNGLFIGFAKRKGWEAEGVDPSPKNAEFVRERFGARVHVSGFLDFDSHGRKFDVISFWDFVEHPPEPSLYLKKAKSLLAPGGKLIIATPNIANFLNYAAEFLYRFSGGRVSRPLAKMYTLEHASYFTLNTLTQFLNRLDLSVTHSFQTESHLGRYALPGATRFVIQVFFMLGRLCGRQNRIVVVAQ